MGRTRLVVLSVLLGLCAAAWAGTTEDIAVIYDGQNAVPAGVVMGNWGFTLRTNVAAISFNAAADTAFPNRDVVAPR